MFCCLEMTTEGLLNSVFVKKELLGRRYTVSGRVQGVGFRYYVEDAAGNIGVQGWVRNRRDGRVEVFAFGTHEQLKELRTALERGPLMSRVTDVIEEPASVDSRYLGDFIIEPTVE
jgi:acylphosphatase